MKNKIIRACVYIMLLFAVFGLLVYFNRADKTDASVLSRELIDEKGQVMLTGGKYVSSETGQLYELNIRWMGTGYLFFPRAEHILINDHEPETMSTYRGKLYRIEGNEECSDFKITVIPVKDTVAVIETFAYFGTYEAISSFDILAAACNYFLEGFCLAVVIFSLVLMIFKPTEKYLNWLALLAFFTGSYYRMRVVFGLLGLTVLLDGNLYQIVNQLILAFIQFRVMGEFMPLKAGKVHCIIPCLIAAVPAALLYRNAALFPAAHIVFYAVLYLMYFICFYSMKDSEAVSRTILLLSWVLTTSMRFLELFCEAGILQSGPLNLLVRLRGLVSVVYIAALFLIVCKIFAEKFNEADRLNAELEKQVEEKSRENLKFVRSMLHNMKTPMFSLSGYSDMALEAAETDPQTAKVYISKLKEKAIYLSRLMDEISLVTRMNSGLVTLNPSPVEIRHVVAQCIETASAAIEKKNIHAVSDIREEIYLSADPIYLPQAIQNVLDNAVIHTAQNGTIQFRAEKSPDGQKLYLTVRDNGCGIEKENQEKIFEAYYSNRHGKTSSTGLGLFITREIIKLHGGNVSVKSEPGEGAEFTLTLPLIAQPSEKI